MPGKTRKSYLCVAIWTTLVMALVVGRSAEADVATFTGTSCALDLRVLEITEQTMVVETKRDNIERLQLGASNDPFYSSRLRLLDCADEFMVKLVSVSADSVVLILPGSIVAKLEIEPGPRVAPGVAPAAAGEVPGNTDAGAAALQAEVTPPGQERVKMKIQDSEMKRDAVPIEKSAVFGSLQGRMLAGGKPFVGCRVKVRRLEKMGFFGTRAKKEPRIFDAVTDEQGIYRFDQLPEGPYDIYWIPPGKNYWVRLLREEPTVVIHAGREAVQPDINADMRAL